MVEMELIQGMYVFMITMDLHGCRLEQTLMEKPKVITAVIHCLYLLTDQGWLLGQLVMMEMDLLQVTYVFMIIMDLHGCKLEQILMEKQQVTRVVERFPFPQMEQE